MILMGNRILILLMVMMRIGLLQAMLVKVVFIALIVFCQNSDSTYNVYCLETAPFTFSNATEFL